MYIYIHVPFCNKICSYCDFPKVLYNKKYINKYLECLKEEILSRYSGDIVKSIFIGGGTPTCLDYNELEKLLNITKIFDIDNEYEFTIESNVDTLDYSKIELLDRYGVNRVSFGVESFNNNILKELNRDGTKDRVFNVVKLLKDKNINNISIDLMYGVNDDMDILKRDVAYFLKLDIPHVSFYSLIIEDNTVFKLQNREYIDEDMEYKMYNYIEKVLTDNEYIHYETSNYAKVGFESIHNINYWDNGSYYGFGLGAISFIDNYRVTNTKNLTKYLSGDFCLDKEYENIETRISNALILGLRKIKGIDVLDFKDKYKVDIVSLYNIEELIKENKLILEDGFLFINPKFYYLSNEILLNFV